MLFETIKYKNFLATGNNWTELVLNQHPSTIISGTNGAGKSTFLDALCFLLFGKPFRNINKPFLVNAINQKDCVVEGSFSIGSKQYRIVRGIKPNLFELYIDGVLLQQDARIKDYQEYLEKNILKMRFKSFTQIVVLGSATFTPFMKLSAQDRRNIVEDLLDIQIFSAMNVLLKKKILEIKHEQEEIDHKKELIEVKIEASRKLIKQIKSNNKERLDKLRLDYTDTENKIQTLSDETQIVLDRMKELSDKVKDKAKVTKKHHSFDDVAKKMEHNIETLSQEIKFYTRNQNCPTCHQPIDDDFKKEIVEKKKEKIATLSDGLAEVVQNIQKLEARLDEIYAVDMEHNNLSTDAVKHRTSIQQYKGYLSKLTKEIAEIEKNKDSQYDEEENLNWLKKQLEDLEVLREDYITEKHYYDIAASLLKDNGVKTKIIQQYLPIINKLVNRYLSQMNFFGNFTFDETFKETMKSRHRDEFSYESFSEGEKKRVDLALLFTWRDIAKLKNSVSTNLLVMDEILDSSLDFAGTDVLVDIINSLGPQTNAFIVSHKGDIMADKFDHSIRFEKKGNFSVMV